MRDLVERYPERGRLLIRDTFVAMGCQYTRTGAALGMSGPHFGTWARQMGLRPELDAEKRKMRARFARPDVASRLQVDLKTQPRPKALTRGRALGRQVLYEPAEAIAAIRQASLRAGGYVEGAALILGVSLRSFQYWKRKLGIIDLVRQDTGHVLRWNGWRRTQSGRRS